MSVAHKPISAKTKKYTIILLKFFAKKTFMVSSVFIKNPEIKKNKGMCHEKINPVNGDEMWPNITAKIAKPLSLSTEVSFLSVSCS
jgi:hypothetical protein